MNFMDAHIANLRQDSLNAALRFQSQCERGRFFSSEELRDIAERYFEYLTNHIEDDPDLLVSSDVGSDSEVYQKDVADLLEAVGLEVYARPDSPHEVVQNEVLPRIQNLRDQLAYERTKRG